MKRLLGFVMTVLVFTACSDAGDERPEDKPTVMQSEPPTSDPNGGNAGPYDTSTRSNVQDSSTVIDYDTSARNRQ